MRTLATLLAVSGLVLARPANAAPTRRADTANAKTQVAPAAPVDELEASDATGEDDDLHAQPLPHADDPESATQLPGECLAASVTLRRFGGEPVGLHLTDCHGEARLDALSAVSALAQSKTVTGSEPRAEARTAARQLNPDLLARLQRIADQFPEHVIEIVSGYRPKAKLSSRHRNADALDIRLDGVDNSALSEFARTLPGTGVGYYPNSTFVHIDVRAQAFYWVDRSGPGEVPDYAREEREPGAEEPAEGPASLEAVRGPDGTSATTTMTRNANTITTPNTSATAAEPEAAELDAELRGLVERALLVMNRELGRSSGFDPGLPARQAL